MTGKERALLLDVEGTTTPVAFVYDVLFPHAYARVAEFLARRAADPEVEAVVEALRQEHARDIAAGKTPPAWAEGAAAYARWLMDEDRKATALKALQGYIWAEGYRTKTLAGQVYDDVPAALRRWTGTGRSIAIFSSGSVQAQKLLFTHTQAGDLTPFLSAHFDTSTGPKSDPESYRRIAIALGLSPGSVLFVSDVPAELDAARAAGSGTALCVRGDQKPSGTAHPVVRSFDEIA